jgi:DNA-directed RNA polymerase subunit RPC12/RpoP
MTAAEYAKQGEGEMIQITCAHCGKPSGFTAWTTTSIFGDLPKDEFQCPKCSHAFARRRTGREWFYPQIELVPIATRL